LTRLDLRVATPKVHTLDVCGAQQLYASAELDSEFLVGGANRAVTTVDKRTFKVRTTWKNCVKYDLTSILHSCEAPDECMVSGLGGELLRGPFSGVRGLAYQKGFHADSPWIGITRVGSLSLQCCLCWPQSCASTHTHTRMCFFSYCI
jgi:hypothetical protein